MKDTDIGGPNKQFPQTLWTEILSSKDINTPDYQAKMGKLISMYWKPVYVYICKGAWARTSDDAKDQTQEFFTRFFEKNYLKSVSPDKGRFRTFVKSSLKHFLMDKKKEQKTIKRGGDKVKISFGNLEPELLELDSSNNPSELFDKEWARTVISTAMDDMKQFLTANKKEIYWEIFEQYNLIADNTKNISYGQIQYQGIGGKKPSLLHEKTPKIHYKGRNKKLCR